MALSTHEINVGIVFWCVGQGTRSTNLLQALRSSTSLVQSSFWVLTGGSYHLGFDHFEMAIGFLIVQVILPSSFKFHGCA